MNTIRKTATRKSVDASLNWDNEERNVAVYIFDLIFSTTSIEHMQCIGE